MNNPAPYLTNLSALVMGDPQWLTAAVGLIAVGILLTLLLNRKRLRSMSIAVILRCLGWLLLAACLVNPLWSSSRPKRGANVLAVVTDVSRSHLVTTDQQETRADLLKKLLEAGERSEPNGWLNRIGQDFELRRYVVSDRLKQVDRYEGVEFDGTASGLHTALDQLKQRFEGQPLAGIILLSDGNATDTTESVETLQGIPPVYPVLMSDDAAMPDVAVESVVVTQTAFDDAPVTLQVQPAVSNAEGDQIRMTLQDAEGTDIESQTRPASEQTPFRFQHRPSAEGTVFYQVQASLLDSSGNVRNDEVTTVNNQRTIAVDRGSQPRRILYVSGRPNWEFKFLRRAVESDPQIQLVGLLRIAKKEARFDFRGRDGERSNSLFRGFDPGEQELAEEYDEPVLVRIGTKTADELRGGFPEKAEDLFPYDAIVLDDIEADFFLADQLKLMYDFVARRGGGLLMMGGQESFRQGNFDRTPVGEILPVDLSRSAESPKGPVRLSLTRDGSLQPWIRLRSDEQAETQRMESMPPFQTVNATAFVRPGAIVMAEVKDEQDNHWPAIVVQRFGKGRTGAVCVGDLWRWRLREGLEKLQGKTSGRMIPTVLQETAAANDNGHSEDLSDHSRACRQLMRWLVADVPRRLDVAVTSDPSMGTGVVRITATVKGRDFESRENADVRLTVTDPDGRKIELTGEPSDAAPGSFEAVVAANVSGPWRVAVTANISDEENAQPLTALTGWACQPDQDEMKSVRINQSFLQRVAEVSGGQTVKLDDLDEFVDRLQESDAPVAEITSWPVWHQWWVFIAAVGCFVGDWTLRRRRGLP